jgi:S-DNA-T family DNA segregation ATPase FtsK/SpoIIIE
MGEGEKNLPQRLMDYARKYYEKMKEYEAKQLFKSKIIECFELGEMYKKYNDVPIYPTLVRVDLNDNGIEAVLNLPRGYSPELLEKKSYVFEQEFGQNTKLKKVSAKTFILYVYVSNPLKEKYVYDYASVTSKLNHSLPIYIGRDSRGNTISYDMIEEPNLLIAGEPGSGKSTLLRSILTTLIFTKTPEELKLYLFDLKKVEFPIFVDLPHVVENTHDDKKISKRFGELVQELSDRGDLLEKNRVPHINRLPKEIRPPYILICVDEFSLIEDDAAFTAIRKIAAIGRALGVYIILSTQRPDAKVVDGRIKALLTVRVGGRQQDATNSRIIIDESGCEDITIKGHMKMKSTIGLIDIKIPLLEYEESEIMLDPLRIEKPIEPIIEPIKEEPKKKKKGKSKKVIDWGVLSEPTRFTNSKNDKQI